MGHIKKVVSEQTPEGGEGASSVHTQGSSQILASITSSSASDLILRAAGSVDLGGGPRLRC